MSLSDWLRNGWVAPHRSSAQEVAELLSVADRALGDAQVPGLSPDGQLICSFDAALSCATAALAACGYRVRQGPGYHQRTVESLEHTIGASPELVRRVDGLRRTRITVTYERAGAVTQSTARECLTLVKKLRQDVERWLRTNHPELLSSRSAPDERG
jgi:hypothetical protein